MNMVHPSPMPSTQPKQQQKINVPFSSLSKQRLDEMKCVLLQRQPVAQ